MPTRNDLATCRNCGETIMWTKYNGRERWCHTPLLRVRCLNTVAEPQPGSTREEQEGENQ